MSDLSLRQTAITLATLTGLAAIVFLLTVAAPEHHRIINVVPIGFAESRGAQGWSTDARRTFIEDETNQWSVEEASQRRPGKSERQDRGPRNWLPPHDQCRYISRFISVMERYRLDGNQEEMQRLRSQRQRCYTQFQ